MSTLGRLTRWLKEVRDIHSLFLADSRSQFNAIRSLCSEYPALQCRGMQRALLFQKERKVFSQNGEDGIIAFLLAQVGPLSGFFVNLGSGGQTSNTRFLQRYCGYSGVDIDASNAAEPSPPDSSHTVVRHGSFSGRRVKAWITCESINSLISSTGLKDDVDVLSIDLDGNDYWIWQSLDTVKPRVCVIEYNAFLGVERSITIPYDPSFTRYKHHPSGFYAGASLRALELLGRRKGYSLVGCESHGVNAFFIRTDILPAGLKASSVEEAFYEHFQSRSRVTPSELRVIRDELPYVEIS